MLRSTHAIQIGYLLLGVTIVGESIHELRRLLPPASGDLGRAMTPKHG